MKFIEYKGDIREQNKPKYKLQAYLMEFMNLNIKCVEVQFDKSEYKSASVARSCLGTAVKRWALPIEVVKRGDVIYFIRRDM